MKFVRVGAAVGGRRHHRAPPCSSTPQPGSGGGGGRRNADQGRDRAADDRRGGPERRSDRQRRCSSRSSRTTVAGFTITINQQDDAVNGKHDADQGAKNMQTLANDAAVHVRRRAVQLQRRAGRDPGQQRGRPDAVQPGQHRGRPDQGRSGEGPPRHQPGQDRLRPRRDDRRQPGRRHGADIAYNTIGAKTAYVLDDTQTYGKGLAEGLHGCLHHVRRQDRRHATASRTRTTDFTSYVTKAKGLNPDVIMYGGVTTSGLGLFRKQMAQQGLDIPLVGGDGINDGSAATASSFLNIAGPTATPTPTAPSRRSTTSPNPTSSRPTTRPSSTRIRAPTAPRATPARRSSSQALKAVGVGRDGHGQAAREDPRLRRGSRPTRTTRCSARSASTPTATPPSTRSRTTSSTPRPRTGSSSSSATSRLTPSSKRHQLMEGRMPRHGAPAFHHPRTIHPPDRSQRVISR